MTNLKDKPFALIGVNSWPRDSGELAKLMTREKLNWRTFDDPDRVINGRWNYLATPVFYIIDGQGTIRRKWVGKPGEKTIDAALEKLLGEAEHQSPR